MAAVDAANRAESVTIDARAKAVSCEAMTPAMRILAWAWRGERGGSLRAT